MTCGLQNAVDVAGREIWLAVVTEAAVIIKKDDLSREPAADGQCLPRVSCVSHI